MWVYYWKSFSIVTCLIFSSHCILNTDQVGPEWILVGVANNSQRGTSERIREKMLKISEKARAAIDNRAISPPEDTSQTNERAFQERVEAAVREERLRALEVERRSAKFHQKLHRLINKY